MVQYGSIKSCNFIIYRIGGMNVSLWGLWVFHAVSTIKHIKHACSSFGDWGFGFDIFLGWEGRGVSFGCYWF